MLFMPSDVPAFSFLRRPFPLFISPTSYHHTKVRDHLFHSCPVLPSFSWPALTVHSSTCLSLPFVAVASLMFSYITPIACCFFWDLPLCLMRKEAVKENNKKARKKRSGRQSNKKQWCMHPLVCFVRSFAYRVCCFTPCCLILCCCCARAHVECAYGMVWCVLVKGGSGLPSLPISRALATLGLDCWLSQKLQYRAASLRWDASWKVTLITLVMSPSYSSVSSGTTV